MGKRTVFCISTLLLGCASSARSPDPKSQTVAVYLEEDNSPACATVAVAPFSIEVRSSAQDSRLAREMRQEIARRAAGKGDAVIGGKWEQGLLTVRVANRNASPSHEPVTYKVTGTVVRFADPACRT